MDLKQIYKDETNKDVYNVSVMEQWVEYFSEDYVKWLENRLHLNNAKEQRELLIKVFDKNKKSETNKDLKNKILDIVAEHCYGWRNCEALTEKLFDLYSSNERELLIKVFDKINRPQITMIEIGEHEELADQLLSDL